MKAIFIGFCSDFKWICGSILNAEVRQASLRFKDSTSTSAAASAAAMSLRLYRFYSNLYVYFFLNA